MITFYVAFLNVVDTIIPTSSLYCTVRRTIRLQINNKKEERVDPLKLFIRS